jgi:hypothetical protein
MQGSFIRRAKALIKAIKRLFLEKLLRRRRFNVAEGKVMVIGPREIMPAAAFPSNLTIEKPRPRDIHRDKRRRWRWGSTSMGGPNMPKRQPCPKCNGQRPRVEKVDSNGMRGAYYFCSKDNLRFFVSA